MSEPYIDLKNDAYGIRSLVIFRPETGVHLYSLVQVLLRGPSPLSEGERELIAAYVSGRNECVFCSSSHAAAANELMGSESHIVDEVVKRNHFENVSPKMRALLNIAGKVQVLGTEVHDEDIQTARAVGAGDLDIHDTVLIAAVFSMFNRYVDGLNTTAPADVTEYIEMGKADGQWLQLSKTTIIMAHIDLHNNEPGIRGLMVYSPETATRLNELAELLLRNPDNSLSPGERELIATYVSYLNDCFFCQNVHGAIAGYHLSCDLDTIDLIKKDPSLSEEISDKMKSLLPIAASVQKGGKFVTTAQIDEAKNQGATDKEIHDTVLIAAAFCMYNRYVDGLSTWAPQDRQVYIDRAELRAREGYLNSVKPQAT